MAMNPLFLDTFGMSFENKVTGCPGNNYLITSVLDQNSITVIGGVSDSHTVMKCLLVVSQKLNVDGVLLCSKC